MVTTLSKLALDNRNININKPLLIAVFLNCHKLTRHASEQSTILTLYSLSLRTDRSILGKMGGVRPWRIGNQFLL